MCCSSFWAFLTSCVPTTPSDLPMGPPLDVPNVQGFAPCDRTVRLERSDRVALTTMEQKRERKSLSEGLDGLRLDVKPEGLSSKETLSASANANKIQKI